jgi:hypothetical protein
MAAIAAHVAPMERARVERIITDLVDDGLVQRVGRRWCLAAS